MRKYLSETIIALMLISGLLPLAGVADETLQQLSESFTKVSEQVTESIVSIKVERKIRSKDKKEFPFDYFDRSLPRFRWQSVPRRRQNERGYEFFFDSPEPSFEKQDFYSPEPDEESPKVRRRVKVYSNEPLIERFFEGKERLISAGIGAGVIVSADGYIVTANHLVEKANKIKVTLKNKRTFDAEVIGSDSRTGVAVIKIDAEELPVAKIGNSDELAVGELVLSIGNPYGYSNSISLGVISGLERRIPDVELADLIQTDAVVNPGSGGGPLVNTRGEVIGMNIAMLSEGVKYQGFGFAIPINTVRNVKEQLIQHGEVIRGWLGVEIQEVDADMAEKFGMEKPGGALVAVVIEDSPAAEAGLEKGDVIIAFDGEPVKSVPHLQRLVGFTELEKTVSVTVVRKGKEQDIEVKIDRMPSDFQEKTTSKAVAVKWRGLTVQKLTDELAQKFDYESDEGVLVASVKTNSPADKAGLVKGALIMEVEEQTVTNLSQFKEAVKNVKGDVKLWVKQRKNPMYVIVKEKQQKKKM